MQCIKGVKVLEEYISIEKIKNLRMERWDGAMTAWANVLILHSFEGQS